MLIRSTIGLHVRPMCRSYAGAGRKRPSPSRKKPLRLHGEPASAVSGEPLPFADAYHTPVMVREVVDALVWDPAGTYVDGTLGGGGHSGAICARLEALADPSGGGGQGRCLSVDRDPEALAAAGRRLAGPLGRGTLRVAASDFRRLPAVLGPGGALADAVPADGLGVHGLLLDLGVSSHQLDEGRRGFSFMSDGPLDMRMECEQLSTDGQETASGGGGGGGGGEGSFAGGGGGGGGAVTAATVVNEWPLAELERVLRDYGEEPRARKVAARLVEARPLRTTAALVDVVRGCLPPGPPKEKRKALSRVFQALRIAVALGQGWQGQCRRHHLGGGGGRGHQHITTTHPAHFTAIHHQHTTMTTTTITTTITTTTTVVQVNDELGALEAALLAAAKLVRPGGRLVVLSYHSLEDRRVRVYFFEGHLWI